MTQHAIKSIHVATSGMCEQHREHRYGAWLPQLWWVLTSRSWVKAPINYFVIDHRDGLVLFDTGLDPAIKTDPNYISSALGRWLLHRLFRLEMGPEDRLDVKLGQLGFSAADVRIAILSHLHFDHVGGISQIPQAELLVSPEEWRVLQGPHPEREWILREHIETPTANWRRIEWRDAEDPLLAPFGKTFDVMADGSMILLPTPGHTPGSISLLVRASGAAPLLLVGDLAYEVELLMKDQTPGTGDAQTLRASYAKVRALKRHLPDLVVLASHDAAAAPALQSALSAAR